VRLVLVLLTLCLASACSSRSAGDPGYDPVPDSTLFARADQVDGVVDARLSYSSTLGDKGYRGEVTVRAGLDREQLGRAVATVYAILRQGRADATIGLQVVQGTTIVTDELPGVPTAGTLAELDELFGPQPGDGTPPPRS